LILVFSFAAGFVGMGLLQQGVIGQREVGSWGETDELGQTLDT
jgi:hypothetical protein